MVVALLVKVAPPGYAGQVLLGILGQIGYHV